MESTVNNAEIKKEASLLEPGDRVICVNAVQGIYKGRCYIIDQYIEPGVATISETDGTPIGAFRSSRFCKDWNAF